MSIITRILRWLGIHTSTRWWENGPYINGRSRSKGLPSSPYVPDVGVWMNYIDPGKELHYCTIHTDGLGLTERLVATLSFDGDLFAVDDETGDARPSVSAYFQRKGDNWSASGKYEGYRWYSRQEYFLNTDARIITIDIPLSYGEWVSVMGRNRSTDFLEAVLKAERVGLVFGGGGGRGHGVGARTAGYIHLLEWRLL